MKRRHSWQAVEANALRGYGSALADRDQCKHCGIFRCRMVGGWSYYIRVETPSRWQTRIVEEWTLAPSCPPRSGEP